jgi:hypothetical protein
MFTIIKDTNLRSNSISSNNKRVWRRIMKSINLGTNSFSCNKNVEESKKQERV